MLIVRQDLRRYVWCWGQVLYRAGILIPSHLEDVEGAYDAGQFDVVVRACRDLAEECGLAWLLAGEYVRPLPPAPFRPALCRPAIPEDLRADFDDLVRGADPGDGKRIAEIVASGHRMAAQTQALIGSNLPNILTPDGYFPALKLGAEWLRIADQVSEEDFLPEHWKPE